MYERTEFREVTKDVDRETACRSECAVENVGTDVVDSETAYMRYLVSKKVCCHICISVIACMIEWIHEKVSSDIAREKKEG